MELLFFFCAGYGLSQITMDIMFRLFKFEKTTGNTLMAGALALGIMILMLSSVAKAADGLIIEEKPACTKTSCSNPVTNNFTQNCNCEATVKEVVKWKTKWKTNTVYRDKIKVVEKKVPVEKKVVVKEEAKKRKNSVSLLGGVSATKLDVHEGSSTAVVETDHELDLGLMYQRELNDRLRGSVIGTVNGSFMLGVGMAW